jgi:hypothetical protein
MFNVEGTHIVSFELNGARRRALIQYVRDAACTAIRQRESERMMNNLISVVRF